LKDKDKSRIMTQKIELDMALVVWKVTICNSFMGWLNTLERGHPRPDTLSRLV